MNINIVYHKADNDGMFGAYLINKYVNNKFNNPIVNFIGLDYPEMPNFKFRHAIDGELADTYIVDISFGKETLGLLKEILDFSDNTYLFEHHQTTINMIEELDKLKMSNKFEYTLDKNRCASKIVYDVLFDNVPLSVVEYVNKADLFERDDDTIFFSYGSRLYCKGHDEASFKFWDSVFGSSIEHEQELYKVLDNGKLIYEYEKAKSEKSYSDFGTVKQLWHGLNVSIMNGIGGSDIFPNYSDPNIDICMKVQYLAENETYKYTLYTDKNKNINVLPIAMLYGGGGHKTAAGFTNKTPISTSDYMLLDPHAGHITAVKGEKYYNYKELYSFVDKYNVISRVIIITDTRFNKAMLSVVKVIPGTANKQIVSNIIDVEPDFNDILFTLDIDTIKPFIYKLHENKIKYTEVFESLFTIMDNDNNIIKLLVDTFKKA